MARTPADVIVHGPDPQAPYRNGGVAVWVGYLARIYEAAGLSWASAYVDWSALRGSKSRLLQRIAGSVMSGIDIVRHGRQGKPVVHVNTSLYPSTILRDLPAVLSATGAGLPILVQFHGGRLSNIPPTSFPGRAFSIMCRTATALGVFPGPQFREVQETRWAEKALQINNVIPETGDEPAPVSEPPHILFLGRVNHAKGADDVLQVFLQLADEGFDDLRLTIAGSGDLETTIRERARSSSYASRISVPGFVKGRELQHIRSEANIFALPSPEHDEGFPLAFLECAERGMACIATINSALPDVFAPGEEFIAIDGSQPGELYDALRNVVARRSERHRLGHAIQKSVRNRFTVSSATGRFVNLYARVRRGYSAG